MSRGGLAGIVLLLLGAGDLVLINAVLVPSVRSATRVGEPAAPTEPAGPTAEPEDRPADAAQVLTTTTARPDAAAALRPADRRPDAAAPIPLPRGVPELPSDPPLIVLRYDTNKVELSADAIEKVAALVKRLRREPELQVMVAGHTDQRGDQELNRRISLGRAKRVTIRLAANRIPYKRITTHGYGASRPVGSANRPGTWVRNRRVEIYVFRKEPR